MASVSKREWTYKGEPKTAWVVRYKEGGKHRSRQFERKRDADAYKQKVEREQHADLHVTWSEGKTIKGVAEVYMQAEESRLRAGQISLSYFKQVDVFVNVAIVPYLGHVKFHELTAGQVEDWAHQLCRERGMAMRQAKRRMGELARMADFAIARKALRRNPVHDVYKRLRGIPRTRICVPTVDEVATILRSLEVRQTGQHRHAFHLLRAIVPLAAFCGLRAGEIIGLRLQHLKINERVIEVRHSLTQWGEFKETKTKAGIRDVPMPEYVAERVIDYLKHRKPNADGYVFTMSTGAAMTPNALRKNYWIPLLERVGLLNKQDPYHFHSLRHFASSSLIAAGMPLTDAASLLGHKHFDVTLQTYAHPLIGGMRRAQIVDGLSAAVLGQNVAPVADFGAQELRTAT